MISLSGPVEGGVRRVDASAIGGTAQRRLGRGGLRGYVHSVYTGAINLVTNQGMVSLVPLEKGRGPLNVNIEGNQWPAGGAINVGDDVSVSGKSVCVGGRLHISLSSANLYDPNGSFLNAVLPKPMISSNLVEIRDSIVTEGRFEGVAGLLFAMGPDSTRVYDLNTTCRLALPQVKRLLGGLDRGTSMEVKEAAKHLVGLGVGLTPSTDDMLAGLMSSLIIGKRNSVGRQDIAKLVSMIPAVAGGRTSLLSWEYMREAAEGRTNENVATMIEAAYTGNDQEARSSTSEVIKLGATSGTDLAVGVLLGVGSALRGGQE